MPAVCRVLICVLFMSAVCSQSNDVTSLNEADKNISLSSDNIRNYDTTLKSHPENISTKSEIVNPSKGHHLMNANEFPAKTDPTLSLEKGSGAEINDDKNKKKLLQLNKEPSSLSPELPDNKTTTAFEVDFWSTLDPGLPFDRTIPYDNSTLPSERQLLEFKVKHPKPLGLLTLESGAPVDVRDTITFNSDLFRDDYFFDIQSNAGGKRVPRRVVHAKGNAVWGLFEVTNDISNFTKAEVFNGIGKKTKVLARLSVGAAERGGSDVGRDLKGFVLKFYTKEGNLDMLNLHTPVFVFKDPVDFLPFVHVLDRNPHTNLPDPTSLLDLLSLRPHALPSVLYLTSDRGIPDGWRHADFFAIHTYELVNEHGERWYARFNWRTNQGLRNLTLLQTLVIQGLTSDYYIRDFYNALANNNTPSWTLEMDILSLDDIQKVNYNPFEVTRIWDRGTYKTVTVGKLTLDRISNNHFRDEEQAAFDPSNLVPGIPGPVDTMFRARRFAYRDAQNYRISRNFYKTDVSKPYYARSYRRDGHPPVLDNEKDAPIYQPNFFNGPIPFVDDIRPEEQLMVLESNAVDLQVAKDIYDTFSPDEAAKNRQGLNIASLLQFTTEPVRSRIFKLLYLISPDLYARSVAGVALLQTLMTAAQASQAFSAGT